MMKLLVGFVAVVLGICSGYQAASDPTRLWPPVLGLMAGVTMVVAVADWNQRR